MVTICLVLSVVNSRTGNSEIKAVVNNKQRLIEFTMANINSMIKLEPFRINKVNSDEFSFEEQMYIEEMEELMENIKNGNN